MHQHGEFIPIKISCKINKPKNKMVDPTNDQIILEYTIKMYYLTVLAVILNAVMLVIAMYAVFWAKQSLLGDNRREMRDEERFEQKNQQNRAIPPMF